MATVWQDIVGTVKGYIRLGFTGVRLKNSGGNLAVRNAGDSADAEVTASKVNISGDVLDINSDAAGAGADWKYTLQRPASGMVAAVVITLPVDDGSPNQVLKTDGNGVTSWTDAGDTASSNKLNSTTLVFGSTSPVAMFTLPANAIVAAIEVIVDTAFDGTPSLSIGILGTTSKFMAATDVDLTAAAASVFRVHPGLAPEGSTQDLIATYAAGGAAEGAARIIVHYAIPS